MNSLGPDPLIRVDPIDHKREKQDQEGKQKQKREYRGRSFEKQESEESPRLAIPKKEIASRQEPILVDKSLIQQANVYLQQLTNLESKVAQLLLLETQASYQPEIMNNHGWLLRRWQIGGVLFSRGSYDREKYLIEYYQSCSTLPLIVGDELGHSLSFFFEKESEQSLTLRHCRDWGKALMGQNKRLGVHFLLDREGSEIYGFNPDQKASLRSGIRESKGLIARDLVPSEGVSALQPFLNAPFIPGVGNTINCRQFIGVRTFFIAELIEINYEHIIHMFHQGFEAFLVKDQISVVMDFLIRAVNEGKISEDQIEKRVLKILALKAHLWG